jgi:hypothetical protein
MDQPLLAPDQVGLLPLQQGKAQGSIGENPEEESPGKGDQQVP